MQQRSVLMSAQEFTCPAAGADAALVPVKSFEQAVDLWVCMRQSAGAEDQIAAVPMQITVDAEVFMDLLDHQFAVEIGVLSALAVLATLLAWDW